MNLSGRKPEVTRTISLPRRGTAEAKSSLADLTRSVSWDGPTPALLGYTLEQIEPTEQWWTDRIHPDDRLRIIDALGQQLRPREGRIYDSESRIWGCDYHFQHADGHYLLVADRSIVTRDETGHVMTIVSVLADREARRSERRAREQMLKSQNHLAIIGVCLSLYPLSRTSSCPPSAVWVLLIT